MLLGLIVDVIIIITIIYLLKLGLFNKPQIFKTHINKHANYGKAGLVIDDRGKDCNKINLIYYLPDHEIAFGYLNIPRKKLDYYSKELIKSAEHYITDMEAIFDKNFYLEVRNQAKEEVREIQEEIRKGL
jgi:hypothetical protein